ncbi:hypothetical protein NQ318_011854 [Aromia moschata]|uniref:Uncharacterized protein n=1 Tax=Aromia moschata TaxID=1265417 RepID=A0AAV8XMP3_9CUCU|nr:hypothetical protein NQ318_011854 [Aromia moschata]
MTHGWERAYNPPALGMGAQEHDLYGGHYNVSDEEVSLYVGESSGRPRFLPSSLSQRVSSTVDKRSKGAKLTLEVISQKLIFCYISGTRRVIEFVKKKH